MLIGPAEPAASYLNGAAVLAAARPPARRQFILATDSWPRTPDFAASVIDAGLTWVGPSPESIELMGDKINARNLMEQAGVPVAPGTREPVADVAAALAAASQIGYPVMIKASAGGGGIGMSAAADPAQLRPDSRPRRSRAERFFGSPAILLERYVERARHVEVQILGLADGTVLALGERDCSVQRRHQKVAEETPSPGVSPELRARMLAAAVPAGAGGRLPGRGDGRVPRRRRRQDVHVPGDEHQASGRASGDRAGHRHRPGRAAVPDRGRRAGQLRPGRGRPPGHALELRIYAEDRKRFLPSPGTIEEWTEPAGPGVRVDSGYAAGNPVTPSTIRCWPSSACTAPTGRRRWSAPGPQSPASASAG